MPKFPENKNYKQSPYPMVEGTSIHKEALEKASPATFGNPKAVSAAGLSKGGNRGNFGNFGFLNQSKAPKPHTHAEGTEGVEYKENNSGGIIGGFMAGATGNSGEEGLEEDHVYESSRGTENA